MFEYMDDIPEIVYVADPETYELFYLNDSGKQIFGIEGDIQGCLCYKVLQGRNTPCSFCTNKFLSRDHNFTWEHLNSVTGHRYLLKDRLVDWNGKLARVEIALDMTASDEEGVGLRNALDAEGMVLQCVHELYRETDLARATEEMLAILGAYFDCERTYIFEYHGDSVVNTYEWCAPAIEHEKDQLQNVHRSTIDRWTTYFERGECVIIESVSGLLDDSQEHDILTMQDISSLAVAPLERDGVTVGFLGIDNPPDAKIHNVSSSLKMLAYFYMMTVQRIENEQRLTAMSFHDELTGLSNRNRFIADLDRLEWAKGSLGIVFIDVNDLKETNDRFGHERGDEVLRACASALTQALPAAELYRIGGDEFVAIVLGVEQDRFLEMVAALDSVIARDGAEGSCDVAIGSQWSSACVDVRKMLVVADSEMYERKRRFHLRKAFSGRLPGQLGQRPGAALDVDAISGESETFDQHAILYEYNMLMSSLKVSVSKHLLTDRLEVVWANDFYYEMTGYTREEYEDLFHGCVASYYVDEPEEFARLSQAINEARFKGDPQYECLLSMPHKGGSHVWIHTVGTITDEEVDGIPVVYCIRTNVTEAVQMRKENSIMSGALSGFVVRYRVTPEGLKILSAGQGFEEVFGPVDGVNAQMLLEENLRLNAGAVRSTLDDMRAGKPVKLSIEAVDRQGKAVYFMVAGDCVDHLEGDPIYHMLYLDTTETIEQRHRAELADEELVRLAFVDPVTDGRNRTRFELDAREVVSKAPAGTYALISLDVQKFKVINDLYGIEEGNRTLAYLYRCFDKHLSEGELVSRISADQFNLLLKMASQDKLASRVEGMVCDANANVDFGKDRPYLLTMTAGVYAIEDPSLPIMQIQDRANVARKKTGLSLGSLCTCRFYSNDDRVSLAHEKDIENRMRGALEAGEFIIYLQPKLDLRSNKVVGAEALVRWDDPQRGLVPPDEFIALFEKNGFIVDLDLHVFERTCALLRSWIDAGLTPIPISVNLSRVHLADEHFLERYERVRKSFGVPASLLEFELTETLVFENPDLLSQVIDHIHACGYLCSMDDFGSGYSSLNVLKGLEVDTLKLDRAFFGDLHLEGGRSADVIDMVIALARRLNMLTVAEGVETDAQAAFLSNAGCDMIQGYLFSRPVPPAEFEKIAFGEQ